MEANNKYLQKQLADKLLRASKFWLFLPKSSQYICIYILTKAL